MITALRSAVLCDAIRRRGDTATYEGLYGAVVAADSRPGMINVWLGLMIDIDKDGGRGRIDVEAADYRVSFPIAAPPGEPGVVSIGYPLVIAFQRETTLTVSVVDETRKGKPFQVKWRLAFHPGAADIDQAAWLRLRETSDEARRVLLADLGARAGARSEAT
jgi:hypothetical protein